MSMYKCVKYVIIIVSALLLVHCRSINPYDNETSAYTEDTAMAHFLTTPQQSFEILDSAVFYKNITPQRADYLRAIIYFNGCNDNASARELCQKLIDGESWKDLPDSEDELSFKVDLYRLAALIATDDNNYLAVLGYCREGVALCHGVKALCGDEADFLSRMGFAMYRFGQYDEALDLMRRAETLARMSNTWSSFLSSLNNSKKIYHVISEKGDFDAGMDVVKEAISSLAALESDVSAVKDVPEGLVRDSLALTEFLNYYQIQFYGLLADCFARMNQLDSVRLCIRAIENMPQSDNPYITKSMILPLIAIGEYDRVEQLIDFLKNGTDECSIDDHLCLLKNEMELAKAQGDESRMAHICQEIIAVDDSLKSGRFQMMLSEQAIQCKLQDEKQRRVDAENKMLYAVIAITVLILINILILATRKIRSLLAKQRELKKKYDKTKEELEEFPGQEDIEGRSDLEDMFCRAQFLVEDQELFRNPSFDIETLARMIPTNRSYLSAAINSGSGMHFRSWLANYRIEYAKKLMLEQEDITVEILAEECGFESRTTLYRRFKDAEGLTPGAWLAKQKQNK